MHRTPWHSIIYFWILRFFFVSMLSNNLSISSFSSFSFFLFITSSLGPTNGVDASFWWAKWCLTDRTFSRHSSGRRLSNTISARRMKNLPYCEPPNSVTKGINERAIFSCPTIAISWDIHVEKMRAYFHIPIRLFPNRIHNSTTQSVFHQLFIWLHEHHHHLFLVLERDRTL